MLLLFNAPAHHTLQVPDVDGPVHGGETFEVESDDRALELATDPHLNVTEASTTTVSVSVEEGLNLLTRPKLDDLAAEAGLDPSDFRTKADVIAALTNQPTAAGEGQTTPETQEA